MRGKLTNRTRHRLSGFGRQHLIPRESARHSWLSPLTLAQPRGNPRHTVYSSSNMTQALSDVALTDAELAAAIATATEGVGKVELLLATRQGASAVWLRPVNTEDPWHQIGRASCRERV